MRWRIWGRCVLGFYSEGRENRGGWVNPDFGALDNKSNGEPGGGMGT